MSSNVSVSAHHIARIMEVMEEAFDPAFGEAWNVRQITDALAMPSTNGLVINSMGNLIPPDLVPSDRDGGDRDGGDRDPGESPNTIAQTAAGFVLTRKAADEAELLLIAISPKFRRKGLAESLLHRLFERSNGDGVTRIFLEMRRGNPAIHLYEKVGFKPIGVRPNYYRLADGSRVDAITFGRIL